MKQRELGKKKSKFISWFYKICKKAVQGIKLARQKFLSDTSNERLLTKLDTSIRNRTTMDNQ